MAWLQGILQAHPEIAFFLVLGLGYLLGKIALGSFKLGAVTGTLLAGVLVGQLGITLPGEVKQCFFLLFLFAIGFRTGPQFFRGLKSDGLAHAGLAAIVATTGLLVAWVVAVLFGYDPGTAAGLIAGSLTESAAIGTAMDAIARLDLPAAERTALNNNIPVAFAVTYLVGVIGAAWVLSQLAPKLMRIDLAEECRKLEAQMQGGGPPCVCATRARTARLCRRSGFAVRRARDRRPRVISDGARVFVEQVRSRGQIVGIRDFDVLKPGDVVAVSGPRTTLVEVLEAPDSGLREVDDRELLDLPSDVVDVVVTSRDIDGRTLGDLARDEVSRGVFLRRITRAGNPLGTLPNTIVQRGDVLTIVGTAAARPRAESFGVADRATDVTDMLVVATGIVAGALIGLPALHIGGVEIGLSLPVGVLLGGLVCGWLRAVRPRLVRAHAGADPVGIRVDRPHGLRRGRRPQCRPGLRRRAARQWPEPGAGRGADHLGGAADRRARGPLAVQDASGRAARRVRGRLHGDTGARRGTGSRPQFDSLPRLWRGLRRGQRLPRHLGHGDRRADDLTYRWFWERNYGNLATGSLRRCARTPNSRSSWHSR